MDIEIGDGETVALVGPNGAGKSTVVDVVAGLVRPDDGEVVLGGLTVFAGGRVRVPAHRRRIGLVGQDPALFPHLSVLDNVAYGPRASGASRRRAHVRAHSALETVGADHLAARRPGTLSGGQAQRIAIARAVATDPALLLLDEPTSALDVGARVEVRAAVAEALVGRSALLVTHDPLEAMTLSDRVVVLEAGRVVEAGPVDTVLHRPTSGFGAAFSGLALLRGTAHADGIVLADGTLVVAAEVDAVPGRAAIAAYHPTAARLIGGGAGPAPASTGAVLGSANPCGHGTVVQRSVDRLEPRDGLVRVVAGEFVVDATVRTVHEAGATAGAVVTVGLPADEVAVSTARA
ncbi:ABC transporter ATP-binding protein [Curtobacterium sp. RRHDQ10]|uniref:ABC transporter ATP-binding protein n=1 Tax=Curtobacterium phyllosphaerae TaxID=3413379 RepID=UPI003BF18DBD